MSKKRKGVRKHFRFSEEVSKKLDLIKEKGKYPSETLVVEKAIETLFEEKAPEAPKTIPAFEIPSEILEKAKDVNTCPNYEAYPKNLDFVKCHAFEGKPRIRSKKDCETCNQKQTLYNETMKILNTLTKEKIQLEGDLRARETSLRTVTSEYNRIKKELETLQEKRASFQVVPSAPSAPDPALIKRMKELETEIAQKDQRIKELESEKPAIVEMAKLQYEPAFPSPFDTEEINILVYEPLLPNAKKKFYELIEKARKDGKKLTEDLLDELSEIAIETMKGGRGK